MHAIDAAARSLLNLADRVDHDRCGAPAALVVITHTGYAYRRPDGVCVVPAGALGGVRRMGRACALAGHALAIVDDLAALSIAGNVNDVTELPRRPAR